MYSIQSADLLILETLLLHHINLQSLVVRRHLPSAAHHNLFRKPAGLRAGVGNGYLLALLWSYKKTMHLRKMSLLQASFCPKCQPNHHNQQETNTVAKMSHPTANHSATSFPTTQPSSTPLITLPVNSR